MRYEELFKDPKLFLSLANSTIPFLNGGLFDCLDDKSAQPPVYIDGFSDNLVKPHKLIVPDFLFFGEKEGKGVDLSGQYGDKKKKSVNIKGLIDILSTYNFTIVENTPIDQEVSLDPELLGKVFENLLASYNPETKSTARKQTGSFYTPREIVQYMVDESLIAYLKNEVGEELEPEYRKLMKYTDDEICLSQSQKEEIIKALFRCKIIDPACGSGAFPVGILQQMVHVLRNIDQDNRNWESLILDEAAKDSQDALQDKNDNKEDLLAEIGRAFDQSINRPDYARKLYLIENCIYGVDIQAIAVQISKLRFFISLVVEQKANSNAEDNFGIRPLPNLEAKFVAANTLIGIEKKEATLFDSPEIKAKEKELKSIRHKIFSAKNPAIKRNLKESDKLLRNELAELLSKNKLMDDFNARILANWDPYDQNASSPFFDPEWMFGFKDGFDIVIGNPPYKILTKNNTPKLLLIQYITAYCSIKTSSSKNLFTTFIELAINKLLSKNAVLSYIVPEGLFKTRSYEKCTSIMNSKGSTISIITFTEFVFENTVTGNLIFVYTNKSTDLPAKKYHFGGNFQLWELHEKINPVILKIQQDTLPLSNVATIFKGMVVKDRSDYIFNEKNDNQNIFLLGKNISKWAIISKFYTNYEAITIIGGTKKISKHNHNPRILIRRTGDTLCCAFLDEPALTESTLYSCWSILPDISDIYLLSLLNSKLLDYYNKQLFITNQQGFPQIVMTDLELLPIKVAENQQPFIEKTNTILAAKKVNPKVDVSILEAEIDSLVYNLYGLTQVEIGIIENK